MTRPLNGIRSPLFQLVFLLVAWLATASHSQAQTPSQGVRLSFPTGDLHLILMQYEELTGKKMILDNAVEGGKVLMDTTGYLSREQAIQFIEQSMLLNGFAIVPSGPGMVKVVAFEAGKQPRNEGIRVVSDPLQLPESDEVITFILPLSYLPPEDAVTALQQIAPGHPYGSITPLANAQALVITENSVTVRAYLDLMANIDVQPGRTEQKSFALERADAEEVVEALEELLGLNDAEAGGTARPASQGNRPQQNATPAANGGGALPPPAAGNPSQAGASVGSTGDRAGSSPPPRIFAVLRTNRVLVIATPFDMARVELLIQELDAPADSRRFLSIPLRYVSVLGVLDALRSSLLSGAKSDASADGGGGLGTGLGGALRPQLSGGGLNTGGGSSAFGSSLSGSGLNSGSSFGGGGGSAFGGGGSGFGGGGGGSSFGAGGGSANQSPVSVIVGKTLIIADPVSNELFISGPPDHLETLAELVEQLDRKPRQVIISAVIGQLSLGNDLEAGIDYFRTVENATAGSLRTRGLLSLAGSATPEIGSLSDLANLTGASTGGFNIYGLIGNRLSTYLTLLENTSRFKVLSNPTVFTLNNVPAAISTGQRIAVPSNSLTTPGLQPGQNAAVATTVQYEEVVLEIQVIPLINSEDEVTLQISQKNDDVGDRTLIGGNLVPNITTQQLTTTVVVPNRSSVLLGGLITERDRESSTGLPILSRIPIARLAFASNKVERDRSELLIFLQPTIVDSPQLGPEVGDEVAEDSALAAGISSFPHQADPQSRTFAAGGGKVPMWKRVFGKKTTVQGMPSAQVQPAAP